MPRAKRKKMPKHTVEVRAYAFPIACSEAESAKLHAVRELCAQLRNELTERLAENRRAVREGKTETYLTKRDQYQFVSHRYHTDPAYRRLHSQVLQNVADRVHEGTQRWFDAIKAGRHHVRPPHPIELRRAKSFTYTQYGTAASIHDGRLHLSKLGAFRLFDYRKIRGKKKTVTLKWRDGRWWAIITVEIQAVDCYHEADPAKADLGGDPGLTRSLTDSAGTGYATPKPLKAARAKLRHEQKSMSRKFDARKAAHKALKAKDKDAPPLKEMPYSNRLKAAIRKVAKRHTKVARVRDHFAKKNASIVETRCRRLAIERHSIDFMLKNRRTSLSASDVALGIQYHALASKLGPARYQEVANRRPGIGGNSQTCLCGASVPKALSERWHHCPECGLEGDRDWISANIVQHMAFGTVHESLYAACGQQVVERALALLERRGETQVGGGETRAGGRTRSSDEASSKRPPSTSQEKRISARGKPTARGKTPKHRGNALPGEPPASTDRPSV